MTLRECTALLMPLAIGLRAEMDAPTFKVYHRTLQDVPTPWLMAAVDMAIKEDRAFLPSAGHLRALADQARQAARIAHKFVPCETCTLGWITVRDPEDVPRLQRCDCWHRHSNKAEQLGLLGPDLSPRKQLPAAQDDEPEYSRIGDR